APGDLVIGDDFDPSDAAVGVVQARGDRRPRPALSPTIGPIGLNGRRARRVVYLFELQLARVRRGRGADLDRECAVVATVFLPAGDGRSGQTGSDALDVDQRLPNALGWRGHLKG